MSEEKKEKITGNCKDIAENKAVSENTETDSEPKKDCFIKVFKEKHPYIFLTIIGATIILFSVLFDQITKLIAYNTQPYQVDFIPYVIRFTYHTNTGAAWGLFGGNTASRILLIIISWAVALGLIGYFVYLTVYKKEKIKLAPFIICAFIVGGDIGNLIDRTFFYERGVIDFLDITSWWPGFGIFNIADSILVCSIFALLIYIIIGLIKDTAWYRTRVAKKEKDESNDNEEI